MYIWLHMLIISITHLIVIINFVHGRVVQWQNRAYARDMVFDYHRDLF